MIRAAIVGLGRWGRNLVSAVQGRSEKLQFTRCVVRRPETAREFAAQHNLTASTALDEALRDSAVDAIVLATPHTTHADQIVAVAAAGKPVFCEKPLALTVRDAQRALDACRRARVVLGLGHDKRFWPSMQELARVVTSGELGEILHVEGHFSNESSRKFYAGWRESPQESPAGGMTAMGIHVLDAFVNLVGPMRTVYAQLVERAPDPSPVDTISAVLTFASGASGFLAGVRTTPQYWRVHVFGKDGSAEAIGDTELIVRSTDAQPRRIAFAPANALRLELEAFADAITGTAPYPIRTEHMLAAVAGLEATIASAERRQLVIVGA